MVLACATRHYGEEPPLIGAAEGGGGSGTLFFSGCTLRCGFCQNRQLSRSEVGREISRAEFVEICLQLQRCGAENINLVSATPFIPSLEAGMAAARAAGLRLPVVWNCSGYELPETVERLAGFVDIFLPDLKLLNPELSGRLFAAADYPARATAAVKRMTELRPGSIIRHLVLPGLLHETRRVLEWFAGEVKERALLSLMVQFAVPEPAPDRAWRRGVTALENRRLTAGEYDLLLQWLDELEIDEGFIQEPGDEEVWWPEFGRHNPFPKEHSKVVWSWTEGYSGPITDPTKSRS